MTQAGAAGKHQPPPLPVTPERQQGPTPGHCRHPQRTRRRRRHCRRHTSVNGPALPPTPNHTPTASKRALDDAPTDTDGPRRAKRRRGRRPRPHHGSEDVHPPGPTPTPPRAPRATPTLTPTSDGADGPRCTKRQRRHRRRPRGAAIDSPTPPIPAPGVVPARAPDREGPAGDHPVATLRACPHRAPRQLPGAPQPRVPTPLPAPPPPYPSPPTQSQLSRDFESRDFCAIILDSAHANRVACDICTSSLCLTAGHPTPAFFISTKKILFLRGEGPGWPGGPLGKL